MSAQRTTKVWDIFPFLCGLPSPERLRRLILSLLVFADDSGKNQQPVFVMAGFISRAENWAKFSDEWKEALEAHPSIAYYKSSEAFSLQGQFLHWKEAARDEKVLLLANIIKRHVAAALSSTVSHEDYAATLRGRINKFMDRAYFHLFLGVMFSAYVWEHENGIDEEIEFIFDEQLHDSDEIQAIYSQIRELAPERYEKLVKHRPSHKSDLSALPLQAADMLAWHIRKFHHEQSQGKSYESPVLKIFYSLPHHSINYPREWLENQWVSLFKKLIENKRLTAHQLSAMMENKEQLTTMQNQYLIKNSKPGDTILLSSIPAKEAKRFLLVHSCLRCDSPHLHRRSGDVCMAENQCL